MAGEAIGNHQFDLLRIVFAVLVLFSHAAEITYGDGSRELFRRLTGSPITLGGLGVYGFFLLSGYLIVQSWIGDPEFLNFLRKRALRILPGYLVAVALSTLAVGLLAPGAPDFFRHLDVHFLKSVVLMLPPATPPVFPGQAWASVNGSLFTIAYECRCYLLVALLGMCGLLRRRIFVLIVTLLLLFSLFHVRSVEDLLWPRTVVALIGQPAVVFRLTGVYLAGCCFYLFRDKIAFRPGLALTAIVAITAFVALAPASTEFVMVLAGGYLMFYLGQMHLSWLSGMSRLPDISYGIYLYGWPVEALWIWYHRGSPLVTFLVSTIVCFALGWLSWHFVERPALRLKRRATAPLPVG